VFPTPCGATGVRISATRSRGVSHLVCGHCGESGHGEEPRANPPHCVTSPEHTHPPTGSAPSSSRKKPFRNFGSRTVFPSCTSERNFSPRIHHRDPVVCNSCSLSARYCRCNADHNTSEPRRCLSSTPNNTVHSV
jgi:hypothetical protein